jgi:hypothetical protein
VGRPGIHQDEHHRRVDHRLAGVDGAHRRGKLIRIADPVLEQACVGGGRRGV